MAKKTTPKPKEPKVVFTVGFNDPYLDGTVRTYNRLSKIPCKIPLDIVKGDKAGKAALETYVVRAEGGSNYERGAKAREALKQL